MNGCSQVVSRIARFGTWSALVCCVLWTGAGAKAADVFWVQSLSSFWNDPLNWDTGTLPGSGDNAVVENGAFVDIDSDVSSGPGAITNLFINEFSEVVVNVDGSLEIIDRAVIGSTTGTSGTLTMNGGTVDVGGEIVVGENDADGLVNQSGGDINFATVAGVNAGFQLGTTGTGTYDMTGGTLSQVGGDPDSPFSWNYIGRDADGEGVFNLTDGAVSFGARTFLGGANGATGTVNQLGGLFEVRDRELVLGGTGVGTQTGEYNISGGTLRVGDDVRVGDGPNSSGVLNVSGTAAVEVGDWLRVGQGDGSGAPTQGMVNQTGGTVDVVAILGIGVQPGATGEYNISGGTLTTNQALFVGGTAGGEGTMNISDAADITANDQMAVGIGAGSRGVLNQAGGVLRVVSLGPNDPSVLWIGTALPGSDVGADAQYNLSGGSTLVDGFMTIGELANTAGRVEFGGTAELTVGTALQVGAESDTDIGSPGFRTTNTGDFIQTAGNVDVVGQLQVGVGATSVGLYEQTGGNLAVGGTVFMGIHRNDHGGGDVDQSNGTLHLIDGNVSFDNDFISAIIGLDGVATIQQDGGTFSALGQFQVGVLPAGVGNFNITGGDASLTDTAFIGAAGTGNIVQSGGDFEVLSNLQMGNDPSSTGTYTMSGGTLNVFGATFMALDGTDLGGGNVEVSNAEFQLSGGEANFNEILFIGFNGNATFNQTGGEMFASSLGGDDVVVGVDRLSNAEWNISGGEAFATGRIRVGEGASQNARLVVSGDALLRTGQEVIVGAVLDDTNPADVVDNNGFVIQSGGTVDVGLDLIIGLDFFDDGNMLQAQSNGIYNLTGGTLRVAVTSALGLDGFGLFTQTGGLHETTDMQIAINPTGQGTYQLQGGVLDLVGGQIVIGEGQPAADDFFEFTGGVLRDAVVVDFDLVNDGGAIEPGASAGLTLINGDYTVTNPEAAYNVEIGGLFAEFEFDLIDVLGTATLDGEINVALIDGFEPILGDTFDVLLAGIEVLGTFATESFPSFNGLTFQTNYFENFVQLEVIEDLGPMCITGDTSECDGLVDIVDLNSVRNAFGTGDGSDLSGIPGDTFPFDGLVDIIDLNAVRNNFGAGAEAVPEPGSLVLLLAALACGLLRGRRRWMRALPVWLVALALFHCPRAAPAQNIFWEGGVSDQWDLADNWVGAALPGTGNNALVDNGTTSQIASDVSAGPGAVDNVFVRGDSQIDVITGGSLQIGNRLAVGDRVATSGTLSVSDGEIMIGGAVDVGQNGGAGFVEQTGGDIMFATTPGVLAGLRLGSSSAGEYTLNGGTLTQVESTPANRFSWNHIGLGIGSQGTLHLMAGEISFLAPTVLGGTHAAQGTVNQTGGQLTVGGGSSLILGDDAPTSDGRYNLIDGDLIVEFNTIVGDVGLGGIEQHGGTHTTGSLLMANEAGSEAFYRLESGTLDAGDGVANIGVGGSANFSQYGGIFGVDEINIGVMELSDGRYLIENGVVNAANTVTVGAAGVGTVDHTGGDFAAGDLVLGFAVDQDQNPVSTGEGTYFLTGGALIVAGNSVIGRAGSGTLSHADGEHHSTGITIAENATSEGTYQLSGGLIDLLGGDINAGDGAPAVSEFFEMTGGTLRNVGAIGFDLTNEGGTIQPGASAGETLINGDYIVASDMSAYDAEIGGLLAGVEHDLIDVIGTARLDGILNVSLIDDFLPSLGDVFTVLTAGTLEGIFSEVNTPMLEGTLDWQVNYLADAVELEIVDSGMFALCGTGDSHPCDGRVDVTDLNQVRNHFGAVGTNVIGDTFPFDGRVDVNDLNAVRNHFGSQSAVPEPTTLLLAIVGAISWASHRRRFRRHAKS